MAREFLKNWVILFYHFTGSFSCISAIWAFSYPDLQRENFRPLEWINGLKKIRKRSLFQSRFREKFISFNASILFKLIFQKAYFSKCSFSTKYSIYSKIFTFKYDWPRSSTLRKKEAIYVIEAFVDMNCQEKRAKSPF